MSESAVIAPTSDRRRPTKRTFWSRETAAALYLRAGFGPSRDELQRALAEGKERTVDRILDFESIPTTGLEQRLAPYKFDFTSHPEENFDQFLQFQQWWYLRMLYTPRGLEEKLTLFWHSHFATSYEKVHFIPMLFVQNQIFRTLGAGKFGDLLLAAARDPAMLIWLDNYTNVKDHPNENFAREVMELFTLGLNHYTQRDVAEAARAFTGWTLDPRTYRFVFDRSVHDDGPKTFLGQSGNFKGEDIIEILASRPETAEFISRKLAQYFLGVDPSRELHERMQQTYFRTDGSIKAVVGDVLRSSDLEAAIQQRTLIKSPTEFIVTALRGLDVQTDASILVFYGYLAGQLLYAPPNVAGWEGGLSWINTGSYLVRMNFANDLAISRAASGSPIAWDIEELFQGTTINSADDVIDHIASRLWMFKPAGKLREALRDYLNVAGEPLVWTRSRMDRWGRGAVHLMLSSPEFQFQ